MRIQTKLTLGPVGDKYEQKADAVAKQVVGQISAAEQPSVQRQEDEEELQMKSSSTRDGGEISSGIENSIQNAKGGKGSGGREPYRLRFNGVKRSTKKEGLLKSYTKYIYVMTPKMDFYTAPETGTSPLEQHHSSFLGGEDVGAAGIMCDKGSLEIDLESGHYQPNIQHMVNALTGLKNHQVPIEKVKAKPILNQDIKVLGHHFFQLVHVLKALSDKTFKQLVGLAEDNQSHEFLKRYKDRVFFTMTAKMLDNFNDKQKDMDELRGSKM